MLFKRIVGYSSVLTVGLFGIDYGLDCGLLDASKCLLLEKRYEERNATPISCPKIKFSKVLAASPYDGRKLADDVQEAFERLERNTGISADYVNKLPQDYTRLDYDDYFLYFNAITANPGFTYEYLTLDRITGTHIDKDRHWYKEDRLKDWERGKFANHEWTGTKTYGRGPMVAKGNHKNGVNTQHQTQFYTNACPQDKSLMTGTWQVVESFTRELTSMHGKVHVFTGPAWSTKSESCVLEYIDKNVQIPTDFFKIIIVEKGSEYHLFSFLIPNEPEERKPNKGMDVKTFLAEYLCHPLEIDMYTGMFLCVNTKTLASQSPSSGKKEFTTNLDLPAKYFSYH